MTRSIHRSPPFPRPARLSTVAVAVASALAGTAWANPSGPSVAAGSASFSASGNTLNVANTPGTIINWQQFSIRPDEITRFIQSGAASAVLNRVTGGDPSQILGQLLSNGRVFLINPNGVTIGHGALIDTAGFVASSLNISDADFLSGRMRFQALAGEPGKVVNQGTINARSGGSIYLIAPTVENHGVTTAPNGDVLLAAGKSVEVVSSASPHIRVELTAPSEGEAVNVGQVVAGRIGIYGGLVRNAGTLNATTATVGENGNIILRAARDVRLEGGTVRAGATDGGAIRIEGDRVVQGAAIDASGANGGTVSIQANTVMQGGRIDARGTSGAGGTIDVQSAGSLVQTAGTVLDASGTTAGGAVTVQGTGARRVFSSATITATASDGAGGTVKVLGNDIVLSGAKVDASGAAGGGKVMVGGDFKGANPDVPNAQAVKVTGGTSIAADATANGKGGDVVVWADGSTKFGGAITARGGAQGGDGGRVEISGKETVQITGMVDASAPKGNAGSLLIDPKNIVIAATAPTGTSAFELNDPNPGANENFGASYVVAGNYAVATDPLDSPTGLLTNAGAAYVFDVNPASPTFSQLVSGIVGAAAGDQVGSGGVTALATTTSFLVKSPQYGGGAGAITFGTAGAFAASGGTVSATNSLIGGSATANVGAATVDQFVSGTRFALVNPAWENGTGAVTFGEAASGMPVGVVSAANSVVGAVPGDQVGSGGLLSAGPTANEAVVIASPFWNGGAGAVRWIDMSPPTAAANGVIAPISSATGVVGAGNSLTGAQPGDAIGSGGMTRLANGNLVISSPDWNSGAGASTWMNGATGFVSGGTGVADVVTAANSLTGAAPGDFFGQFVTPLANGNYVLLSPAAFNNGGAVTLVAGAPGGGGQPIVNGSTQPIGPIGSANSLLGGGTGALADAFVQEIFDGGTGTDNGYLVLAPSWGGDRGAITFSRSGGAGAGPVGLIDATNSLVGSATNDRVGSGTVDLAVVPLSGGWYAVQSPFWNAGRGAITFVTTTNAAARLQGSVSAANSLLGGSAGDHIGTFQCDGFCSAITDMGTGTFLVASPDWSFGAAAGAGAVTLVDPVLGSPTGPRSNGLGTVTATNSIHGTTAGDAVGRSTLTLGGGVFALDGDRFAISSPDWDNVAANAVNAGALTFGTVSGWTPGPVATANSLYGTSTGDRIGSDGLFAVFSAAPGTFGLASSRWNTDAGAVTFFDVASLPLNQAVSGGNSVVGQATGDVVGSNGLIDVGGAKALIMSPNWRGGLGAVTLVDANLAKTGFVVTPANSFTGAASGDLVGAYGVTLLPNGNFVVRSDANGAGAYTFMTPGATRAGEVLSSANSLTGGAGPFESLGFDVRVLSSGDYVVVNPNYGGVTAGAGRGMIVFGSKDTGVTGSPSVSNGWLGTVAGEQLGANVQLLAGNQFVFNAPGATKGSFTNAGRLFVANPAGLGGGGINFTGTLAWGDAPGADVTIAASQIATILNSGTQVLLQASNDITVNAAIAATGSTAAAGSLTMQAGRSILVNENITNLNRDGSTNRSIALSANDPAAVGPRDPGPGELRVAPGKTIVGGGDVLLEVLDALGTGVSPGGMTVGSVSGQNVELYNSDLVNPVFTPARSIDIAAGSVITATDRFALVADGDARFGIPGGAGALVQGMTSTTNVVAFGAIVGGSGTLIDASAATSPINLSAQSIGAAGQPFGLIHGSQGVTALATAGGIHLAQTAGTADTGFYSFDAPAGQQVTFGALGGQMDVSGLWLANANPTRLYTTGDDIRFIAPVTPIDAASLQLDAGAGQIVVPGGKTFNTTLNASSFMALQGGTTTFNGPATLNGLAVTGNGTRLDIGAGPVTTTSLTWGQAFTAESNTIAGGTGATLTVTGSSGASISGDGIRTLDNVGLVLGPASSSLYVTALAGGGAINLLGTASIANNGNLTISNDNPIAAPATSLNTFTNAGFINKLGGTGTTTIGGPVGQVRFVNTGTVLVSSGRIALASDSTQNGTVDVAAGTALDLVGGLHTGTGGIGGAGALTVGNATFTAGGAITTGLTQVGTGGTLTANNALTGQLDVLGGTVNLNGVANTTGVTITGGQLNVAGALTTQAYTQTGGAAGGPGDLAVQQSYVRTGGTFGTPNPFDDLDIFQSAGSIAYDTAAATGSLRLAAPGGNVAVTVPVTVARDVELAGASLDVGSNVSAPNGIRLVSPSAQLASVALTGNVDASAASVTIADGRSVALNGNAVFGNLTLGGAGTALALGGAATVNNTFLWQGASGGASTISGGSLNLAGGGAIGGDGTHNFDNVQVANGGNLAFGPTFGAGGPLRIQNGAVMTNTGTFNLQNDQPILSDAGIGTLNNAGTMIKSGAGGSTVLGGGAGTFVFNNTGSVQIDAGQLVLAEPGTYSGTFTMGPGGGLAFASGAHTLTGSVNGGTFGVGGTANVTLAGVLNTNLMDISGGALTIGGSASTNVYNQTGGAVGGTGKLGVASSFSQTGGTFGNTFNTLTITQAAGNLSGTGFGATNQLSLAAPGGAIDIGTPLTLAGAASFFGGTGINVTAPVTAASVGMVTPGTARISNATVQATSGAISVGAGQLEVTAGTAAAGLVAAGGLSVASLADVIVQGGTASGAAAQLNAGGGPLAMSVQRDLKILGGAGANAFARVIGNPDVGSAAAPVKVGGAIVMQEGSGANATARIESVSPNSIYVSFPNLASGGYTVNGQEFTSLNGSGFYAGGQPAILAQNLFIDYGLVSVQQFDPGVLVTALNQATQPLADGAEGERRRALQQAFDDIDDAPVCK